MTNEFDHYRAAKKQYGGRVDTGGGSKTGWIIIGVLALLTALTWVWAVPGYQMMSQPQANARVDSTPAQNDYQRQPDRPSPKLPGLLLTDRKPDEMAVVFIDVGQGDAIFIQTPDKKNILLDTGEGRSPDYKYARKIDAAHSVILPFFERNKIEKLDYLITSHPHSDHIGAARDVIMNMPVDQVWIAGKDHPSTAKEKMLEAVKTRKASYDIKLRAPAEVGGNLKAGMSFDLGRAVKGWVLRTAPHDKDINNASLTILLYFGETGLLFTGDTEEEGEMELIEHWGDQLNVDIYKTGHHGSRTSSTQPFIDFVQPKHSIFMVGHYNTFGHPTDEVLSRVKRAGSEVHRTDEDGTIFMFLDGKNVRVQERRDMGAET